MQSDTYHAFMLDHASGTLPPALRLAGDIHTALDKDGASESSLWDMIGGCLLDNALEAAERATPERSRFGFSPKPIAISAADIINADLDALQWRRGLAGVDYARVNVSEGQFMRLQSGQHTPEHGHSALEATVVLRGTLDVDGIAYTHGQLVIGAPGERHQPVGGTCGECICYVGRESLPFWRLS